jgi:hypothetical protein
MSEMKMDEMSVLARILNVSGRSFSLPTGGNLEEVIPDRLPEKLSRAEGGIAL